MILEYRDFDLGTQVPAPTRFERLWQLFFFVRIKVPVKYLMCHPCMNFPNSLRSGKYYSSACSIFIGIIRVYQPTGCLMQIWILREAAGKAFSICIFKNWHWIVRIKKKIYHKIRNIIICYRCDFQELRFLLCVISSSFFIPLFELNICFAVPITQK